jgi:hypothetical protein
MMGQIFSWTPAEWGEIEVDVRDKGTNHLADVSSGQEPMGIWTGRNDPMDMPKVWNTRFSHFRSIWPCILERLSIPVCI